MYVDYTKLRKSDEVREIIKYKLENNIPFTLEEYATMTTGEYEFICGLEDE